MAFALKDIKGSIPPIITPFKDGAVDYETYARLIERQVSEGSHGILVTGTTAEPSTLTLEERKTLLETTLQAVAGRVPVVAATGSQSHAETLELTRHADAAGADALLIVTPYYIRPPQRGLVEYYVDLAKRTERPVMIYHIPGRAAVSVTLDTLKAIKERADNLVGMKHAVNDLTFASDMIAAFGPDWKVFVGLEEFSFPMMAVGACGLMNAVGNLLPGRVAALCEAVWAGRLEDARTIHYELWDLNKAVFFDTNPIPMKYMMKRLGLLADNEHRLPMMPATPEVMKKCDAVLAAAGLLPAEGLQRTA
ncbi:MAG TPA: 4-hydroxy-tetrahydrodipicolinate synthase [Kiloniellales bacterium]|nr:4-hydroxy-tetrahydrodipicolinate synthase [Kiloniellales bacterium]